MRVIIPGLQHCHPLLKRDSCGALLPAIRSYRADIGYTPASSIADPAGQAVGNSLTAGAIAGIVVGTVAGTVLVGVLCVLLGRGYNKYRSHLVIRM